MWQKIFSKLEKWGW